MNFAPLAINIGANASSQRQQDDKDNIERQKAMAELANMYSLIQQRKQAGQQPTMVQDQQGNWWGVDPQTQTPRIMIPARPVSAGQAGLSPPPTIQTRQLEGGAYEYSYTDPDTGKPVVKIERAPAETSYQKEAGKLQAQKANAGTPDADTLSYQASLVRTGMPISNFVSGFGDKANEYRRALWKEVQRQAKEAGDPVGEQSARMASRVADQAALTQTTKQRAAILAFEKTTDKQFDMIIAQSKKVPRTDSPLVNQYEQWLTTRVAGDLETQRLFNLIATTTAEYAKVMTGNTGATASTDSARAEAAKLLSAAFSEDTLSGVIDTMRQEMGNRKSGLDDQIKEIKLDLSGGAQAKPPAQSRSVPPPAKEETKSIGGKTYIKKDGKWFEK